MDLLFSTAYYHRSTLLYQHLSLLYFPLPWLYFTVLNSTGMYHSSTSLYLTLLACTVALATSLYLTQPFFYFSLLDCTYTLLYHGSTSLYFSYHCRTSLPRCNDRKSPYVGSPITLVTCSLINISTHSAPPPFCFAILLFIVLWKPTESLASVRWGVVPPSL